MFIAELFEEKTVKHASFCFGRMNPPTIGHRQLIETVAQSAKGGDYFIFASHSQDPKKNPLDPQTKIAFIREMFPEYAAHVVDRAGITTALHAAAMLYDAGYTSVTFVAGSDRLDQFRKLLVDYNGVEGKGHGYYKFVDIDFVSSGERDPDADGLAGISASMAREAAKAGDKKTFAQATGAGKLAPKLYQAVRAGMNIKESFDPELEKTHRFASRHYPKFKDPEKAFDKWVQRSLKHSEENDVLHNEQISDLQQEIDDLRQQINILKDRKLDEMSGVIASKSQATDPRYMMSLTKDVRPGETERQLRKMQLK